jgi:hypothetical protein
MGPADQTLRAIRSGQAWFAKLAGGAALHPILTQRAVVVATLLVRRADRRRFETGIRVWSGAAHSAGEPLPDGTAARLSAADRTIDSRRAISVDAALGWADTRVALARRAPDALGIRAAAIRCDAALTALLRATLALLLFLALLALGFNPEKSDAAKQSAE